MFARWNPSCSTSEVVNRATTDAVVREEQSREAHWEFCGAELDMRSIPRVLAWLGHLTQEGRFRNPFSKCAGANTSERAKRITIEPNTMNLVVWSHLNLAPKAPEVFFRRQFAQRFCSRARVQCPREGPSHVCSP